MPEITHYKIVWAQTYDQIQNAVSASIPDGWQPFGHLLSAGAYLSQPMVKYNRY